MELSSEVLLDDEATPFLKAAVGLHREQLAGGFMTSLGPRFLLEVFRNIARSRHGVALLAVENQSGEARVHGFLLGATDTSGLYRDFLLRHGLKAALFAVPRLVRPAAIKKVLETLRYPGQEADFRTPDAELLDLAVSDEAKGTGLAQELFRNFVAELRRRGYPAFRVTTGGSLKRAHGFYEKQGAVRVGTLEIHEGQPTVVYVYPDPGARESDAAGRDSREEGA